MRGLSVLLQFIKRASVGFTKTTTEPRPDFEPPQNCR